MTRDTLATYAHSLRKLSVRRLRAIVSAPLTADRPLQVHRYGNAPVTPAPLLHRLKRFLAPVSQQGGSGFTFVKPADRRESVFPGRCTVQPGNWCACSSPALRTLNARKVTPLRIECVMKTAQPRTEGIQDRINEEARQRLAFILGSGVQCH